MADDLNRRLEQALAAKMIEKRKEGFSKGAANEDGPVQAPQAPAISDWQAKQNDTFQNNRIAGEDQIRKQNYADMDAKNTQQLAQIAAQKAALQQMSNSPDQKPDQMLDQPTSTKPTVDPDAYIPPKSADQMTADRFEEMQGQPGYEDVQLPPSKLQKLAQYLKK